MKILHLLILSMIASLHVSEMTTCEEYIELFDGCTCDSSTADPLLYGPKSFLVNCGSVKSVLSVNPIDRSSIIQVLEIDDEMANFYKYKIIRHLTKDNEFMTIKEQCPFGSIQTQTENGLFKYNKAVIGQILYKILFIARHYYDKNYILTNLNPGQICLDRQNNPKIFDIRFLKRKEEMQVVNSYYQYLPPEYFQAYQDGSEYYYDDKFVSYNLGYIFYYLSKGKDPYLLKDSKYEKIWEKEIVFDKQDSLKFLNFIIKTLTNHHTRFGLVEAGAFFSDKEKYYFSYGTSILFQDRYYTLEDNILHDVRESSKKLSIPTVIFITLATMGAIVLLAFLFCRQAFSFFVPQMEKNEDVLSENSGEASLDLPDVEQPQK